MFAQVEIQGFTLSRTYSNALDHLCSARMPLGSLLLHKAVDDRFKRRRVRIAACFACRHCFAKDGWADEQFHVLCKDRQDTRFIRFDESISITGNFHEDNYTMLYNNIQTTLPQHHISVIAGGPYNSGILAVGPREGATFNYRAASAEMRDKAQRINAVCERYQVPLKAAALQFILAHPAVASVIPGARSVAEVEENVRMVEYPIPADLWAELKQQGLIAAAAPTSSAA